MRHLLLILPFLAGVPAAAEVPRVLADTAPVHSLVSMVMGDLGSPELIVPPGTSPHDANLSPSEAMALTEADLIVWTGPGLLPWMGESLTSLAPDTATLALLETEGWEPLPLRDGAHLGEHDHDHADHNSHDHASDDTHEHAAEEEHREESVDPHAWLDPDVAVAWIGHIAGALSEADPDNADTYERNAVEASEHIASLRIDLQKQLEPLAGLGYAVGHDAYQYLERAAGLPANWAVANAAGQDPAPRDVAGLRDAVLSGEVVCLLLDAETDPAWAQTLGEGMALRTVTVDPDGVNLEPGPTLYPALMQNLAEALQFCLAPE